MRTKILASELLAESVKRHNIHLSLLVADTGLWVNPEVHYRLVRDTGSAAMFPKVRRARISQGEQRGQVDNNGVRFDDNSYANRAVKSAAGLGKSAVGFEACHIWPLTCYDERYHTVIANIVLLPRALASLSDHVIEIQMALQYRAFELYGWFPEDVPEPVKPDFYPSKWREPQPDAVKARMSRMASVFPRSLSNQTAEEKYRELSDRVLRWSRNPDLNVHKIIALVVQSHGGISSSDLVRRVANATQSRDPDGAVASLMTDKGNAYGRIFARNDEGIIIIHPTIEKEIRSLTWSVD